MNEFDKARREWNYAIDVEAARLVRAGVPPFDAAAKAREIVSERLEREARNIKLAPGR